jgi:hypothetical protein
MIKNRIVAFALGLLTCVAAQAQAAASVQTQIAALSAKITTLEVLVAVQTVENLNLQKQITLLQSNETMQASNLAVLTKSFTPVQSAVTATQGVDTAQSAAIAAIQAQLTLVASNPALQLGPFVSVDPNPENGVTGPNIVSAGQTFTLSVAEALEWPNKQAKAT